MKWPSKIKPETPLLEAVIENVQRPFAFQADVACITCVS